MNIDSNCNNIDEILKVGSEMFLATDEDNQPGRSTAAATETDENKKSKKKIVPPHGKRRINEIPWHADANRGGITKTSS